MKRTIFIATLSTLLAVGGPVQGDGACCLENGACLVVAETSCIDVLHGFYAGDSTNCADIDDDGIMEDCLAGPVEIELPKLYWFGGPTKLQCSNLDGSGVQTLVTGLRNWAATLAADARTGTLFWADERNIWRASLDGTDRHVIQGAYYPGEVIVDPVDGKVYWRTAESIIRANLDGSHRETVLTAASWIEGFAIVHDPLAPCQRMDADGDGDIDLADFAEFQRCYTLGPG